MKKYEITVEATSFDGHQVFACEAESKEEAKKKFKAGECGIIECNIEVLGLGTIHEICESEDIESRLLSDLLAVARNDLEESNKMVTELLEVLEGIDLKLVYEYSDEIDKVEKLLAKARGEQ